jgi:hypothetical protein
MSAKDIYHDPLILDAYRQIIEKILMEYAQIPYAYGEIQCKTIFDRDSDSYLLMILGWHGPRRVHGCLVHIDIIDDKVWIQRDGTEYGIAKELVEAGIPKTQIVLGFHEPEVRKYTKFAAA